MICMFPFCTRFLITSSRRGSRDESRLSECFEPILAQTDEESTSNVFTTKCVLMKHSFLNIVDRCLFMNTDLAGQHK